jgi:hypothetical protein
VGQVPVTSAAAIRAWASSTVLLPWAKAAIRAWTARLLTAGDAACGLVDERDGVVGEQRVGAAGELQVVLDVAGGLGQVHAVQVVAQPDALVQRGHGAQLDALAQRGLAQQQAGERRAGVEVVVGEHTDFLELLAAQQVGLVDDEDRGAGAFVLLGGEQLGGLQDDVGLVEAGGGAQRADDVGVETPLADHGVGQVDDGVADGVEAGDGGAGGDGLAGADLAGDHPEGALVDQPGDAGNGFGVGAVAVQHAGGEIPAEGLAVEAVVGAQALDHRLAPWWSWWLEGSGSAGSASGSGCSRPGKGSSA